jgi:putative ABC transport system ATP-binding protein
MSAGDGAYLAEKLAFYECCEKYVTECFASGCASVVLGGTLGAHMSLIELKDVSKLYGFGDATSVALDEVSLKIEKGECVAVMGPSGSGKSTLMNMIGLLDHPTHGDYLFGGKRVSRLSTNRRARIRRDKIGFIFQSFNLLGRLTAIENVALPLLYRGFSTAKRNQAARAMLERVGLTDRCYYYPRQLSGGQTQCVAIARALVNQPEIIIADEPTGNLDTESSRLVMELLSEINKSGNTIIFVTHNPELTRYATRVVYMQDGLIKHDEQTRLGEVGRYVSKFMYTVPTATEEDDLAGVSALMKIRPEETESSVKKTQNNKAPKRRTKRKSKRKGGV